jgi:PhzF family phenazine biosynthesis protein
MRVPIFQVDAFTDKLFAGNPAAVIILESFLPDRALQAIAAENNLAETAFVVQDGSDYRIRWFTPLVEVPLCGHATLASAAVILERLEPGRQTITFRSASGPLMIRQDSAGYVMNFPARSVEPIEPPPALVSALGIEPVEVLADPFNYLAVLENADLVRRLTPRIDCIAQLDRSGMIVTASGGGSHDFVSRYFAPAKGISEDPVTGGAHCALAPFWAKRLGKSEMRAFQASKRGGEIFCRILEDRVELGGKCVFYLEGHVELGASSL